MNVPRHGRAWLADPPPQHPLSDLDQMHLLIGQLPVGDSMTVLQKITAWITEIIQIPDLPLQHQFDVLDLLDRFAKNHQLNLAPGYLDTPRMLKLSESELWKTSFEFWHTLGNGYLRCLDRFQAGEDPSKEFRQQLPLIAGRILRSLTLQLKWTLLRYARVDDRLWRDLGSTYLFAGNWGFSTHRSAIYPGSHGESTAQEEILKALMLTISAPDALTPTQIHIAERIVAHFAHRFALHTTPGAGCTFTFDLSMHMAPARGKRSTPPAPLLRFFGPGTAVEGLHQMATHLQEHNSLPADMNMGGTFDSKAIRWVINHLVRCWSDTAVVRRRKRQEVVTRLTVVHGLNDTLLWLKDAVAKGITQAALPHASESWVVSDASDGGCGAVMPARSADWLEVGALVGTHGETAAVCRMGILRRITTDTYGQFRVGIEHIGDQAAPVRLYPANLKNPVGSDHPGEPAILLSQRPDAQGLIELLMHPGSFNYAKTVKMRFLDRVHKLEFATVIKQTRDYKRVACRLGVTD